jgi:exodeoxyribonuclease-3
MMKIVSWNVNGLRAIVKKLPSGLGAFFKDIGADIICLQESKITEKMLTDDLTQIPGYEAFFATCKMKQGYSGVWYESPSSRHCA